MAMYVKIGLDDIAGIRTATYTRMAVKTPFVMKDMNALVYSRTSLIC